MIGEQGQGVAGNPAKIARQCDNATGQGGRGCEAAPCLHGPEKRLSVDLRKTGV